MRTGELAHRLRRRVTKDMTRVYEPNLTTAASLLLMVLVAGGCGDAIEPMGPGTLQIEWHVAATGCESNNVDTIDLQIRRDGGVFEQGEYDCASGGVTLEEVPRANYQIDAVGLDAGGETRFRAKATDITVQGEERREFVSLELSALPARATIRWQFANAQVCGTNGAQRVQLTLFGPSGFSVWSAERDCPAGALTIPEIPPGTYDLVARARGRQGATQGQGTLQVQFAPGGSHDVTVEVTAREPGE